jgi:myo-inositol-1(or 4)-monophosphatase
MFDLDTVTEALATAGRQIRSLPHASERPQSRDEFLAQFQLLNSAASDIVRGCLAAIAPEVGWLDLESAESMVQPNPSGTWWVCDPIDGAVQLIQGIDHWSISLALLEDGTVTASWVYDPIQDEMFHAARGKGSRVNGRPMRASEKDHLEDALVATSHAPDQNSDVTSNHLAGSAYAAALEHVGAVRNLGPTSLQITWVADGRLDSFWAYGADASNWIAGELLAAEAGATITDLDGARLTPGSNSVLISGRRLHAVLRQTLTQQRTDHLIDGRSAREFVMAMARDCFPPTNIGAAEAMDRWTRTLGYRQVTNGVEVSRDDQVQHLAHLQSEMQHVNCNVLHAVFDGSTLAVLQQVETVTHDGTVVKTEVAAFFTIRDGRVVETNELTRAVEAPAESQQVPTAR